jgi:succinate-semialdehyde dehydrogenase / glutarate-semialdehyde dehydrogenase
MKYNVRNPRNGQFDYQFEIPSTQKVKKTCEILRGGQGAWQAKGVAFRIETMQKWKQNLEKYRQDITEALTHDTGRKAESILETQLLFSSIDRWCGISDDFFKVTVKKTSAIPFIDIEQDVVPFSLVGVISPWNFPLLLSIIDAIPALLAGCAVVVKPSEVTPRFIEPLMKSIRETPDLAAVFNYMAGAGKTGSDILKNVDLVCFTGSVLTGKKVYAAAAKQFIPVFLELGGKDAALVFEGANLDLATSSLLWGSSVNAGHSCLSIERIYVQEPVFNDFVALLVEKAKKLKFAYPSVSDGQIGPIISDKQVKIIDDHLKDALEKGAKLHTGKGVCENIDGGYWCFPTVLTNVNHDMKIMTEETFGPIMPIMPFKTEQEGTALANATIFGLSGAVFTESAERSLEIGRQLEAGAISINDSALTAIIHEGEKNSFKASGIGGTRMGAAAIKRFMRQKAFLIKRAGIASPWWF